MLFQEPHFQPTGDWLKNLEERNCLEDLADRLDNNIIMYLT
jgi:hypothetical protein